MQLLGFSEAPQAGDEMRVARDLGHARTLADARAQRVRLTGHQPIVATGGARLEDLFEQLQRGETATLNLVLKADVQGSLEACTESLRKLERDDVKLAFVHRGVGGITENDVQLAKASNATIIGFNVRPDRRSREMAEDQDVEIRTYEIIYKLIEDVQAAMLGLLAPGVRGDRDRRRRGPRDLQRPARRPRSPAASCATAHHAGLQGPVPARRRDHLEGHDHVAAPLQGRRPRGRRGASSAASGCRTSRT